MRRSTLAALTLATSLAAAPLAVPAFAATPANTTANTTPAVSHPAGATAPSQQNPLLADNGSVRIGKMIGTDIYNDKDQKLGTVDGVLMNKSGQPEVIVSHDNKLVQVPWSKFQFGNADQNGDNKVLIPGMTKDQLGGMQAFHYTARNAG